MTNIQRSQIERLRYAGKDYKTVAKELGLSVGSVKVYCSRHKITDSDIQEHLSAKVNGVCPFCGDLILQRPKTKPRRFCSDKCRYAWWSKNADFKKKNALYQMVCQNCGKEFVSYGKTDRKFCCHECYIFSRFGGKKKSHVG